MTNVETTLQNRSVAFPAQALHVPRTSLSLRVQAASVRWKVRLQRGLYGLAVLLLVVGIAVSNAIARSNNTPPAYIHGVATNAPNVTKIAATAMASYTVAPTLPRYLIIPKLGVSARVFPVGLTKNGDLGTPSNVYDSDWYNQSALPGHPGATLIDGHVSSWTSHGVFYGLGSLRAGDQLEVEKGDGSLLRYNVVKTVVYQANEVNMVAAMTPISSDRSGLNLISCAGDVIPGTNEFNERIVVFASQQ